MHCMRESGKLSKGMENEVNPIRRREMEKAHAHTRTHQKSIYRNAYTHEFLALEKSIALTQTVMDVGVVVAAVATTCKRSKTYIQVV